MIPGSANPLLLKSAAAAAGDGGERSLRFNSSDSGFLSRTPAVAGNRRTWTWAGWVKRTVKNTATDQMLFTGGTTNSDTGFLALDFNSSDKLRLSSAATNFLITTAVYRDPGAWMHIVLAFDATQGTNANKVKLYVNSTEVTVFDTDGRSSISNQDYGVNQAAAHEIGRASLGSNKYLDGYLAECYLIDGQALDATAFTEVSATTGQLIPKAYTGTFGTNGFWLKFSDNSAATAAALGNDYSGNNNDWTPNNLSVTAGAGNDSLVDTPTSYGTPDTGVGGEVRGNYCTLNPLDNSSGMTLANGNLDGSETGGGHKGTRATIKFPASGKWYYEGTVTTLGGACCIGAATNAAANPDINASGSYYILVNSSGNVQRYQSFASYTGFDTPAVGTILRVAYDADAQKLWLGLNALWMNGSNGTTGDPATGANATFSSITDIYPAIDQQTSAVAVNFGQRAFAYTAPSGFKALCDTNLGAPLVAKPSTVMDVSLYSGNSGTNNITGLGFSPDLIWIKMRSGVASHSLYDILRGTGKTLSSNATNAEATESSTASLTAFNSNGFSLGTDNAGIGSVNLSGYTYAAWCWDAGTSTVTNTQGSITSQVRANVSAGFSVVTYTGTGSAGATIGHGLGVAPAFLIIKGRGHVSSWHCYHSAIGNTSAIFLSSTSASVANSVYWNNTSPGSTTFTVGTSDGMNGNTNTYVAYCFSSVVGYSSFGSYTGNGSTDGPFVYTGFRPRWILIKNTSATADWSLFDTARDSYNQALTLLAPNLSAADNVLGSGLDILSNGFKLRRDASPAINASSNTFVYAAFAENPFQYARAR